jgi:hypothetical protein
MRRPVAIGLSVLTAVLIIFDIYLALNGVAGDTYSEIIRDAGHRMAFLPWCVGGLIGHWFWNGKRRSNRYTWGLVLSVLALLEYLNLSHGIGHPFVSFFVGMLSGRLVWAMEAPK